MESESVPQRIGYQGVPGAYSEEALRAFVPAATPVPLRALPDVFAALDAGEIDRALVPVENSHAGSVAEAYDLMLQYPVTVGAEYVHQVRHFLLGVRGAARSDIETVFSHPQALAQSDDFLREAQLEVVPFYDTAGAAQMVAERQNRHLAAVAGRLAGEHYGLEVLAEEIQTAGDNATRFFLLQSGEWTPERTVINGAPGRTSLVFGVEHQPGALVRALTCFARERVNLSRLESRPSRRRPWEYLFFADVEGYAGEPRLRAALRELGRLNPFVRVLGSYPAGQPVVQPDDLVPAPAEAAS
ncbi:MAG TPA: prephenate dehydratase [Chloroflexota bacterium]|nr:prephenate dehydratase [Chloroflexota bacterium]